MKLGMLYGVGVGPGDPELITVKGAAVLASTRWIYVPKASNDSDSLALGIARCYLRPDAEIVELVFPMATDPVMLAQRWTASARRVAETLQAGEDACFVTLGDPSLYSTWIYLQRALGAVLPEALTSTIPGVMAIAAAAALAKLPLGEGKQPVTIVPSTDDMGLVRHAIAQGGTVALMKVGHRLQDLLAVLAEGGALERAVLVARAGLDGQRLEHDLGALRGQGAEAGYLSVVLVPPAGPLPAPQADALRAAPVGSSAPAASGSPAMAVPPGAAVAPKEAP